MAAIVLAALADFLLDKAKSNSPRQVSFSDNPFSS
jgi:hypothetical protein